MKDATGEVSMTVVTIVVIGLLLVVAGALFYDPDGKTGEQKSTAQGWIEDIFKSNVYDPNKNPTPPQ